MKNYDKNKELSYLKYWDANNLYGWIMSQKLPVNKFKLIEDNYQLEMKKTSISMFIYDYQYQI